MTNNKPLSYKDFPWKLSYRSSELHPDGRPVNILHDFYTPALERAVRYHRIAGYFRSSSLAAASQGFSAFIGNQGRMRLITGADLEPRDVAAILQGSQERLTDCLNKRLENSGKWPAEVVRGVQLLAWMVANEYLDVKVALRTHITTREPISYDSSEDGYVHEKWAIFEDSEGNRLYTCGTLNESRTALLLNAENIDIHCDWRGGVERQRVDDADNKFHLNWANDNPALSVLDLPEAVRRNLIKFAEGIKRPVEIDGSSSVQLRVDPPSAQERLRFSMIADGPKLPEGRYVGMATAPVEPWPHQSIVARRLIENWPSSFLLCDEVGLGKTIEAGLAIRSLYLSGLAKRIMIAPPASLTHQWHREMAFKFSLPFGLTRGGAGTRHSYLLPDEEEKISESVYEPDLTIVSNALVARRERTAELERARDFDIVLIDEAHYLRRANPQKGVSAEPRYGYLYKQTQNILRGKAKCLLLATATPMQLEPVEVYDLLKLTHRTGSFLDDPALLQSYYDTIDKATRYSDLDSKSWEFLRGGVKEVEQLDPQLWYFIETAVMDKKTGTAARPWLEKGRHPRGRDKAYLARLLFAAAPLSRVMLRHTRELLEIYREKGKLNRNLAKRRILPVPRLVFNKQEQAVYEQLKEYCRELSSRIRNHSGGDARGTVAFWLSFLRLRLASSLYAIKQTLSRRIDKVNATMLKLKNHEEISESEIAEEELRTLIEGDEEEPEVAAGFLKNRSQRDLQWERRRLKDMLATLEDLSLMSPKMRHLLKILEERRKPNSRRIRQTVVFTRFYDTLSDIRERLLAQDSSIRLGAYSGRGGEYWDTVSNENKCTSRENVKKLFMRNEVDVLICTDAAAEGLNLQTADFLINYDLPWNPMKVEQRIGRIDRIGQVNDTVYVLNLCYADSAEQFVYDRLLQRLNQANAIVGMQQFSLLQVTCEEFEQLANGEITEKEIESRALKRAEAARQRSRTREVSAQEKYDIYSKLTSSCFRENIPVTLEDIWDALTESRYLRDLGCEVRVIEGQQFLVLCNIPGISDDMVLTTSRQAWESGVRKFDGRLFFAAYGDPVFDALITHMLSFELPTWIKRIAVPVPGTEAEQVGYAIPVDKFNFEDSRLLTRAAEAEKINDLPEDENSELSEEALSKAEKKLRDKANCEFEFSFKVPRIENLNQLAGHLQLYLDYRILGSLIRDMRRHSNLNDNFWRAVQEINDCCSHHKDGLRTASMPAEELREHLASLPVKPIFELQIPQIGDTATVKAPPVLVHSALQAGCRLADGLHKRKADLSTEEMLSRIDREGDKLLEKLT